MAMSPPVGRLAWRVGTVAIATLVVAAVSVLGAEASRSTAAITIGLVIIGLDVMGLLPRAGPRAAAMQLPLIMGFADSAGHVLADASAASRAEAVLRRPADRSVY